MFVGQGVLKRWKARMAWALACVVWLGCAPVAMAAGRWVATQQVDATNGKTCMAYLVAAHADVRDAPLVLAMNGTGHYSMRGAWDDDDSARVALDAGAAWLTFDKPGVVADDTEAGFRTDDAIYNHYTLADLSACATHALAWAVARAPVGQATPIVLRGHSEGAIVSGETLLGLYETGSPLATRVSALLLSGTPAGSMRDVVMAQARAAGKEADYLRALETDDHAFFRARGGVGAGTLRSMLQAAPLSEQLMRLARHRPAARITLFHGDADAAVPVAMPKALLEANRERILHGEPALQVDARYYDAGHGLDAGAMHDIHLWLLDALSPKGYVASLRRPGTDAGEAVEVDEAARAGVVGVYRVDEAMELTIHRDGTRLFAQATGQDAFPIYFTSADRLTTRVAPITLEIERERGAVVAIHLIQGGTVRCPRIH